MTLVPRLRLFLILLCAAVLSISCSAEAKKERHWKKGEIYFSENKFRDAVIEFKNVVQIDPNDVKGHMKLGSAHLSAGEFREAHAQFTKCIQLNGNYVDARIQLGRMYLLARKYDSAREQAEAILAGPSSPAQGHLLLSMVNMAEKKLDDALIEAQKAVTLDPKNIDALLHLAAVHASSKNMSGARKAIQDAITIDPKSAAPRNALARIYMNEGEYGQAESELTRIAASDPNNIGAALRLGDFYIGTNSKDKGLAAYKKILDQNPKNEAVLVRLAELSLNDGRVAEGADYVDKLLKVNVKSAEGQLLKGRIHLMKKEFNEALILIQAYCRDYPKSAPGHYFLGLTHFGNKDLKQAQTHVSEAIQLRPQWIEPRILLAEILKLSGSPDKALIEVNKVLEQSPLNTRAILKAGELHLLKKDYASAEKVLSAAAQRAPDNPFFRMSLGRILLYRNKEKEAVEHLEGALKLRPGYIEPLQLLIGIDLKNKAYSRAESRIQSQVKLTPPQPMYDFLLGRICEVAGDVPRSETYYQKAASAGHSPEYYNAMAGFYIRKGLLQKAEKQFIEAVRLSPNAYPAHMGLGLVYEALKNNEKAKDHYRKALAINPKLIAAANNLAYLYAEGNERIDEALNLAQSAKETAPEDPYLSDTLGWVYYKKNIFTKAVPYLKEANEKIPGNPLFRYHLGMAYYRTGNLEGSVRELTKAVSLNPNLPEKSAITALLDGMKKGTATGPAHTRN